MTLIKQTRNIVSTVAFAATALFAALPSTAHAGLIPGGTFTNTAVANYAYTPSVTVDGWDFSGKTGITVANASFQMIGAKGAQAAFLQGADAEISAIRYVVGGTYTLSFDAQGRYSYGTNPLAVYLIANDVVGATKIYLTQSLSATYGVFTNYTLTVNNMTEGYYKLVFDGLGALDANRNQRDVATFVDNITDSTPVPEPTSLALLGLGLLGLVGARRNRKQG